MRAFRPRDIFHLRRLHDIAMSPDGAAVAYCLAEPDPTSGGYRRSIYLLGTDAAAPRPLTRGPADHRPWFSPDGRHLAFLRRDAGVDQVHLLPLGGGEAVPLTVLRHGVDSYAWGPHGHQIAVLSSVGPAGPTMRQLYHFDLDGTWRQLSSDAFDHADAVFAPAGRHIACTLTSAAGDMAVATVPVDGGPWRLLTPWQARWARPVFAPDGGSLFAFGCKGDEEPSLWRIDLAGQSARVSGAPWPGAFAGYVQDDVPVRPDLFVTGDGQALLALLCSEGAAALARCSIASGRWQVEPTQGLSIQSFATTSAGDRFALLAAPAGSPPEVLVRDEDGQVALRSDHHELFLADATFAAPEHLGGTAFDAGLLLPPGDLRAMPLALVLADPPDSATGGVSSLLAQALRGQGLAVLRLALRPAEAAQAAQDPATLLLEMESLMLRCGTMHQGIDTSRVAVVGEGVGGYLALMLLSRTTDAWRAAVAIGAPTDLFSLWGSGDLREATALSGLAPPWQDPEPYLRGSPLLQAHHMQASVLLVHGANDSVVPAHHTEELCLALRTLERPVRCEIYEGLGHALLREAPLRLQAQILELIAGWTADQLAR